MYDAGVLNLGDPTDANSTYNQLNETFGTLVIAKSKGILDASKLAGYEDEVETAIESVYGTEGVPSGTLAESDIKAVGLAFWRSLTPNQLINVLIGSVSLPNINN